MDDADEAGERGADAEELMAEAEITDINSYDDDAHKAAVKMQQAGRGMLARKHQKRYLDMKWSETVGDVPPAKLWEVLGQFEAGGLKAGGWYADVPAVSITTDKNGGSALGSKRTVVPEKGWWCEVPREEELVTRNASKRWLTYAIVGPSDTLAKAKYTDCTVTWKVREADSGEGAEGAGSVVLCTVRLLPKNDEEGQSFTEEQISPLFATEFKGTLEAVLKVATGQVPETAAAADPPAQAAEPAAAEGEKPVEEAPAADAPDAP